MSVCYFGNWLDKMCYEDALETAEKALNDAIKIGEQHLIGSAHFNVGLCYNNIEKLDNDGKHFQIAYEIHKNRKHIYESKAIFNLAYVKAKKNDLKVVRIIPGRSEGCCPTQQPGSNREIKTG